MRLFAMLCLILASCGGEVRIPGPEGATAQSDTDIGSDPDSTGDVDAVGDVGPPGDVGPGDPEVAPTWAAFTKVPAGRFRGEVYEGDWSIVADPCVVDDGAVFRMFYTCLGPIGASMCESTSPDGVTWTPVTSVAPMFEGVVLHGVDGAWDEQLETCSIVKRGGTYELYYSGYHTADASGQRLPAALGLATSSDGVGFARVGTVPVLTPTPGGIDSDDIFSADIFEHAGLLHAIYAAWCVPGYNDGGDCDQTPAIQLGGAVRHSNGTWVRHNGVVLAPDENIPMMRNGVAEPAMLIGPDGRFYVFFSAGLGDDEPRVTAIAVGDSPFGPWEVNPQPVIVPSGDGYEACGTFAPEVLLDGDIVRAWYITLDDCHGTCPSCNFGECGCDGEFSIGYAEAPWPLFGVR